MTTRALARRTPSELARERGKAQQSTRGKGNTLPEYLEEPEIAALERSAPHIHARLLILIQWRAGLRVSEAVALEPGDLTLESEHPTLRVRRGKGNKTRIVPVHPELAAAFTLAMGYGRRNQHGPFIQATRQTAWRWIQQSVERAIQIGGIATGKHIGTHTLRHSAARHWLANGVPINVVQGWLGHANLQTTLIYLQILPDPTGYMDRVP